ncbi:MAG: RluA family pseudouridine synthase [Bdellovibrionota bacterium]
MSNDEHFKIVFEDTHILVVDKMPGLLSQGGDAPGPNLVDLLREYFGRNYVGLVHRLDRNTSGLMIVGKRSKSADRLTQSLQKGDLTREYLAFLQGNVTQDLVWRDWLTKNEATNTVRCSSQETPGSKLAVLGLKPVSKHAKGSLCRVKLETGRGHQIRAQAAHHGHPLAGDPKYAPADVAKIASRQALHSAFLSFPHPMSHERMDFESTWPKDLAHLCQ